MRSLLKSGPLEVEVGWTWSSSNGDDGNGQRLPDGSDGKRPTCNAGAVGSIPGSERSPGEANGYPLQYSCLENTMDRGAWWAIVLGLKSIIYLNGYK